MRYRFERHENLEHSLRRIAHEQLTKALAEIDRAEVDTNERVHQARKRCKKLRGVLRFVRDGCLALYEHENAAPQNSCRRPPEAIFNSQG